jgi:hypothetical protein
VFWYEHGDWGVLRRDSLSIPVWVGGLGDMAWLETRDAFGGALFAEIFIQTGRRLGWSGVYHDPSPL